MLRAKPSCRIDGILARDANLAVIFRRGPSDCWQMLLWNLDTDEVTPGQWMKGRLYPHRCDISPNGKYCVVTAAKYNPRPRKEVTYPPENEAEFNGWTAICRPPYFTAIALWYQAGAWNGGGVWKSNDHLLLNNAKDGWHPATPARGITTENLNWPLCEDEPLYSMRLEEHGWKHLNEAEMKAISEIRPDRNAWRARVINVAEKSFSRGSIRREGSERWWQWAAFTKEGHEARRWASKQWETQFLEVDKSDRVIFSQDGCLWAWSGFPHGKVKMIADLNGNVYDPQPSPDWARQYD